MDIIRRKLTLVTIGTSRVTTSPVIYIFGQIQSFVSPDSQEGTPAKNCIYIYNFFFWHAEGCLER